MLQFAYALQDVDCVLSIPTPYHALCADYAHVCFSICADYAQHYAHDYAHTILEQLAIVYDVRAHSHIMRICILTYARIMRSIMRILICSTTCCEKLKAIGVCSILQTQHT